MGIFTAAGVIVFAFIGFDLIATVAEDARDPRRACRGRCSPRSASSPLSTSPWPPCSWACVRTRELGTDAPVSDALRGGRHGLGADVINIGALLALTTVVLVVLIAQSRVLFAMGRDGLLPPCCPGSAVSRPPPPRAAVAGHRGRPARARPRHRDARAAARARHLVRVRLLRGGRHLAAQDAARPRTRVPGAPRAAGARPVAAGDGLAVAQPHRDDVARLRHLDGRGPAALPDLRASAQRAGRQPRPRTGRRTAPATRTETPLWRLAPRRASSETRASSAAWR